MKDQQACQLVGIRPLGRVNCLVSTRCDEVVLNSNCELPSLTPGAGLSPPIDVRAGLGRRRPLLALRLVAPRLHASQPSYVGHVRKACSCNRDACQMTSE